MSLWILELTGIRHVAEAVSGVTPVMLGRAFLLSACLGCLSVCLSVHLHGPEVHCNRNYRSTASGAMGTRGDKVSLVPRAMQECPEESRS